MVVNGIAFAHGRVKCVGAVNGFHADRYLTCDDWGNYWYLQVGAVVFSAVAGVSADTAAEAISYMNLNPNVSSQVRFVDSTETHYSGMTMSAQPVSDQGSGAEAAVMYSLFNETSVGVKTVGSVIIHLHRWYAGIFDLNVVAFYLDDSDKMLALALNDLSNGSYRNCSFGWQFGVPALQDKEVRPVCTLSKDV